MVYRLASVCTRISRRALFAVRFTKTNTPGWEIDQVSLKRGVHMRAFAPMTRRDSRSVQNASTPFESRGLETTPRRAWSDTTNPGRRHEGPHPRVETRKRSIIPASYRSFRSGHCHGRRHGRPRKCGWGQWGRSCWSAHAGRKRISIKTIRSPSQINYLPAESWIRSFVELSCLPSTATVLGL